MKRAIDAEQKKLRRKVILDSALSLFEERDGQLSTVSAIAERSKIAKGTIYLYFQTREEIYLALLEEFINDWFNVIDQTKNKAPIGVNELVKATCNFIVNQPTFMKLASIFNGILEKNIDYETAYNFKANLRDRIFSTGKVIESLFENISHELAAKLILRSFALSIGLWQIAEPAPILKQILKKEELSVLKIDFLSELEETLGILWKDAVGNN